MLCSTHAKELGAAQCGALSSTEPQRLSMQVAHHKARLPGHTAHVPRPSELPGHCASRGPCPQGRQAGQLHADDGRAVLAPH